jgi:hypothetical protein
VDKKTLIGNDDFWALIGPESLLITAEQVRRDLPAVPPKLTVFAMHLQNNVSCHYI